MLGMHFFPEMIPGMRFCLIYGNFNTPDSGSNASGDRNEFDLNMRYTFSEELEGLSLRIRHAIVNANLPGSSGDMTDTRVYLQYEFEL
jgi:hypothetical protein